MGWSAYALAGVIIFGLFRPLSARMVVTNVAGCAAALVVSHALRGVILRRRWFDLGFGALAPRLIAGAVLCGLCVEVFVLFTGIYATRVYSWASSTPGIMFATTFNWCVTFVLWVVLYAGVHFFRNFRRAEIRRLELEVRTREAQLGALQAQIHPHFLFNALNSLRALIAEDPQRARTLVTELADLLRYGLQAGRRERVPLAEELAVIENYLKLEAVRFEDRLRWSVSCGAGLEGALVPPMLLQTLVENAVKHGIAALPAGGEVHVRVERDGAQLRLEVVNPGLLGVPADGRSALQSEIAGGDAADHGIGLANATARLALLYGDRARLSVAMQGADRVRAVVELPLEMAT